MGSAAVVIGAASLLLQGGSMVASHRQQTAAAQIEALELETVAKQEELGAIQREADRKARLSKAMASQIASAGSKGISAFEGSPLAILEADIEAEAKATERDVFQTRLSALTLRTKGKMAKAFGTTGANIGLLSSVGRVGLQGAQLARTANAGDKAGE